MNEHQQGEHEVLVLEDEQGSREELRTILSQRGLTTMEAESTVQIFKLIELRKWNWRPRAAIVDLVLPGATSGYDAVRRLRERFRDRPIPIIVVSKLNTQDDFLEAQFAGAAAYVTKPMNAERIFAALDFAEDNHQRSVDDRTHTIRVF